MKLKSNDVVKGMAFAGCSFTWGQNLWYYSNMPTIVEQKARNNYYPNIVNFTHRAYAHSFRYPRLVAQHFNTFELCHPFNGGSNSSILDYWERYAMFGNLPEESKKITWTNNQGPAYDIKDVGVFILQLTQWMRTDIKVQVNDINYGTMQRWALMERPDIFFPYLKEQQISVDEFVYRSITDDLQKARNFLLKLEEQKINVYIISWPSCYIEFIKNEPWLTNKLIKLEHNDTIYYDIETLIEKNPYMSIAGDTDFFVEPPPDEHPSLKCHRVIADSIIRHIENEKQT
jgi:hypothetical protein